MAVVNRNSNLIANTVASPKVLNAPANGAPAALKETVGYVTPAADDTVASIHRFVRVPSNARISALRVTCAVATTAGAVDIGVYQTAENGGAVVDADYFASAQALSGAALADADLLNESGTNTLAKQVQPLWQALGLSADPMRDYDIAWTITTTFNGGPVAAKMAVRYTQ
jgi:hypothetical protein